MKRSFRLELYDEGKEAACYAVKFYEKEHSEPEQFENNIHQNEPESFEDINYRLENMLEEHLFLPPMLELEEGKRDDWVVAIKTKEPKQLRWYGLRYSPEILILGNGGLKTTKTYQEDPHLHQCVQDLQYVFRCIQKRMKRNRIEFDTTTRRIKGNIEFPVKHFADIDYPEKD